MQAGSAILYRIFDAVFTHRVKIYRTLVGFSSAKNACQIVNKKIKKKKKKKKERRGGVGRKKRTGS